MTLAELEKALKERNETLLDVIAIYSIEHGSITEGAFIPNDSYVFTIKYTYIVSCYDGQEWFEAVPTTVMTAREMTDYGDYGG